MKYLSLDEFWSKGIFKYNLKSKHLDSITKYYGY